MQSTGHSFSRGPYAGRVAAGRAGSRAPTAGPRGPHPTGGGVGTPLHTDGGTADPVPVPESSLTGRRVRPSAATASPYDAVGALDAQLERLRAAVGASRVAVWLHEATTRTVVPFTRVERTGTPGLDDARLRGPLDLGRTPFLSAAVDGRRAVVARDDDPGPSGDELRSLGVRAVHAEPLLADGEVVGVLVVDPAAAALPGPLRHALPGITATLRAAAERSSEQRRLRQAEVLLEVIEAAAGADSMDQLLGAACQRLAALGDAERACVFLLEDGRLVPRMASYADGRRDRATWELFRAAPEPLPLAEEALRTGGPVSARDDSPLLAGWWAESFAISSAVAVPLGRVPSLS